MITLTSLNPGPKYASLDYELKGYKEATWLN